jgi:hypothetical protein
MYLHTDQRKICVMVPHAEADLTLCPLQTQSRLPVPTHEPWALIGQLYAYASVDLNPMPESTVSLSQELRIWPQSARVLLSRIRERIKEVDPLSKNTTLIDIVHLSWGD